MDTASVFKYAISGSNNGNHHYLFIDWLYQFLYVTLLLQSIAITG